MNSSCTFFYPDYPDAGLEKRKNDTIKLLNAGKKETDKQEKNKSKSIKPICDHSTPFCTYIHPDHYRVGGVNGNNSTTVMNGLTVQDLAEVYKTPTTCKDLSWGEIEVLKTQKREQSIRELIN